MPTPDQPSRFSPLARVGSTIAVAGITAALTFGSAPIAFADDAPATEVIAELSTETAIPDPAASESSTPEAPAQPAPEPASATEAVAEPEATTQPAPQALLAENTQPVALNDFYTMEQDGVLTVPAPGALTNDHDPEGDPFTMRFWTHFTPNGKWDINTDGSFVFTPNPGFFGEEENAYTVADDKWQIDEDGFVPSQQARIIVTVLPSETAPVANDDDYTTIKNQTLTDIGPGVLANDTDPENDTLTAKIGMKPSHGKVTLDADGGFSYKADPNYVGADFFTYYANDGIYNSVSGRVDITVEDDGSPDYVAPVAHDDFYEVVAGQTLTVPDPGALANDEGSNLIIGNTGLPGGQHGTTGVLPGGGFTYTPEPGFVGVDTIQYKADDGITMSNTATIFITVLPGNQPPVIENKEFTIPKNGSIHLDAPGLFDFISDPENDDVSFGLIGPTNSGSRNVYTDGEFIYQPDQDFVGTDTLEYTAFDDFGNESEPGFVIIHVVDAVTELHATDDEYTTDAGVTVLDVVAPGILDNDTSSTGNALELVGLKDLPAHGTVTLQPDGSFHYEADAGFIGEDAFTYLISDGEGSEDEGLVELWIGTLPTDSPEAPQAPTDPIPAALPSGPERLAHAGAEAAMPLTLGVITLIAGVLAAITGRRKRAHG